MVMNMSPSGVTSTEALARDAAHLMPVYARYPVVMDRGEGVYLFDVEGKRYLDMMAGLGVNALGHAHPRIVAAAADQFARLVHLSPLYSNAYPGQLAEELCALSGMTGCFFSTGGAEAVEGALKLARSFARRNFSERKHRIVSLRSSYHGRTFGSLSVTGQVKYQSDFGPGLPGVDFIERDDLLELRATVTDETCAILIEPVMGEGGVYECSHEFLAEARRLATAFGALLIFDEIQCGLGRTGSWFAFERSGVRPDVLILGKPLGGGIPLSAMLVTDILFHAFGVAKHGSTLGGSPLACRLGVEFLRVMADEQILARVQDTGDHLQAALDELKAECESVVEVRGAGLLHGIELSLPARPVVEQALHRGVLLNCVQGNVVRFLPPLISTRSHVDEAVAVLRDLLLTRTPVAMPVRAAMPEAVAVAR